MLRHRLALLPRQDSRRRLSWAEQAVVSARENLSAWAAGSHLRRVYAILTEQGIEPAPVDPDRPGSGPACPGCGDLRLWLRHIGVPAGHVTPVQSRWETLVEWTPAPATYARRACFLRGPIVSVRREADVDVLPHGDHQRVRAGGRVLTGGTGLDHPGRCHAQAVLTDLAADTPLSRRKTYGPVASRPHMPSGSARRGGYSHELIAHGTCEFTNARAVWFSHLSSGGRCAEQMIRCDCC